MLFLPSLLLMSLLDCGRVGSLSLSDEVGMAPGTVKRISSLSQLMATSLRLSKGPQFVMVD